MIQFASDYISKPINGSTHSDKRSVSRHTLMSSTCRFGSYFVWNLSERNRTTDPGLSLYLSSAALMSNVCMNWYSSRTSFADHIHKQAFIDIAASCSDHVSASRPLWPNMTLSIKPEVHNVSQRHYRKTKPQPQGICTTNFVNIGPAVPEIC